MVETGKDTSVTELALLVMRLRSEVERLTDELNSVRTLHNGKLHGLDAQVKILRGEVLILSSRARTPEERQLFELLRLVRAGVGITAKPTNTKEIVAGLRKMLEELEAEAA